MPLPVTNDQSPDVLEGHEPRAGRDWRGWAAPLLQRRVPLLLVGGGLTVALLGGLAFLAAQDDGTAVVDASGSMELNDTNATHLVLIPHSTQQEGRGAIFSGPIRIELPDRQLVGEATLHTSYAGTDAEGVVMISHSWGHVDVTFGSTTCSGPFAISSYREPRDTSGAMSLRCDDGSLFAATPHLDRDEEATADHPFRFFLTLEDGAYAAG